MISSRMRSVLRDCKRATLITDMTRKFDSVLVANRGEIACRIIRSVRAMGMRSIAVYSEADAGAPHVTLADRSVCIGAGPPSESYLSIARVLESARHSSADAIHPGYGFLAENAAFATACEDADIVFIGPSPHAISAMGNKAEAKRLMRDADVACVPGYDGADQSDAIMAARAAEIGFPIMIKAAAGGGGRGMRLVEQSDEMSGALRIARSEAINAFGSNELILEKAIRGARHVEIQIVADNAGHTVHLGERDCSVQRRHQKLIEEAPCPVLTTDLREQMGAAAVRAARAIGYSGVGTVEFLLDQDGSFYFLEMNTRLQVEHPVTEMVTGLDLVELQIRVARGEALGLKQREIALDGHAIEARLCTEDPSRDFMPATGTITRWHIDESDNVRIDSGIREGQTITPFYDALAAKVIAHGETRDAARRRLVRALRDTTIFGLRSNRAFLIQCLENPHFASGKATTAFVDDLLRETRLDTPSQPLAAIAAALLFRLDFELACARGPGVATNLRNWSSGIPLTSHYSLEIDAVKYSPTVSPLGPDRSLVVVDGNPIEIGIESLDTESAVAHVADLRLRLRFQQSDQHELWLALPDHDCRIVRLHQNRSDSDDAIASGLVRAPMHGVVQEVVVAAGDTVAPGQPLLVLEAMKMQQQILAPVAAIVMEIHTRPGQQVVSGDLLITLGENAAEGGEETR